METDIAAKGRKRVGRGILPGPLVGPCVGFFQSSVFPFSNISKRDVSIVRFLSWLIRSKIRSAPARAASQEIGLLGEPD